MSTGWLRDLASQAKWYTDKDEPWRVRAAPGHLVAFCGTLPGHPDPNPVRAERHASLIALAPEMAVLLADTIDALECHRENYGRLDAEDALLARFAALQPEQPA